MRIPKQFYFKVKASEENENMDNYFSFNQVTEEGKDQAGSPDKESKRTSSLGGHPLVPRLNLPRQDPNEEWREIMAQQQSYEDVSSSSNANEPSSSNNQSESADSDDEEEEEESSSYVSGSVSASASQSISRGASQNQSRNQSRAASRASKKRKQQQA